MKFQRRLADSLSIKLSFCKHLVALFCAKLITSTLWVSSLGKNEHSVNGGHKTVSQTQQLLLGQTSRDSATGNLTFQEVLGRSASLPAQVCAAAASAMRGTKWLTGTVRTTSRLSHKPILGPHSSLHAEGKGDCYNYMSGYYNEDFQFLNSKTYFGLDRCIKRRLLRL